MSLNYVQEKIGYNFGNILFLSSALIAAEKDDVKGEYYDGNRGLSNMGVCAMEMVTTRKTIMFNGTKSRRCARLFSYMLLRQLENVDSIQHWSRSKRGRASACTRLGLACCVVKSVRQSHEEPSDTVLSYTLSAIIGAVWFDMEASTTGLEMMNQISNILARIDMLIANNGPEESLTGYESSLSMRDSEDTQESSFTENQSSSTWNQYTSPLEVPLLQRSLQGQDEALKSNNSIASGPDFEIIQPLINPDPFDQFQGTVHDPPMGIADALLGSMQSMHAMRFDSAATESIDNNNPLLELEGTIEDTYQGQQISNHTVAGTREAGSDTTETPRTHIRTIRKITLHERHVSEELDKIRSPPTGLHENLMNLLDHGGIDGLSINTFQASQLKMLYFAIGSCQSLRGFKEALQLARGNPSYISNPSRPALSCAERFQEICRLDDTECLCILLRRFHTVKLFEEEMEVLYPSDMIIVETPSSFVEKQTAEMGNPTVRRKAALTDAILRKIKPELQEGTSEHRRCRTQVKYMRRLAELLGVLTGTYGSGILALLPCRPGYSEFSPMEIT
jgi:hypothetical protein